MREEKHACSKDTITFFARVGRVMGKCTDSVLESKPKCHFPILHRLAAAIETSGKDGSINVSDLAKTLYDSPQGVSRGLRILEQDGLVERCTDPTDRRKTLVRLTPYGQEAHDACKSAIQDFGAAVAARLGPERLARMHEDFEVFLAAMEAEAGLRDSNGNGSSVE